MQSKNQTAEKFANEAVFVLQLDSYPAIRYIERNADVDLKTAEAAFKSVVKFHQKKACQPELA